MTTVLPGFQIPSKIIEIELEMIEKMILTYSVDTFCICFGIDLSNLSFCLSDKLRADWEGCLWMSVTYFLESLCKLWLMYLRKYQIPFENDWSVENV